MANKLRIEGVPAYDGEYDIDINYFTNREFKIIKDVSGVRAGELEKAFEAGDNDLMVAVAVIVLRRAGKDVNVDLLWDAEAGKITYIGEPAEDPQIPSSLNESQTSNGGNESSGGPDSRNGGDASLETSNLHSIGSPSSPTTSPVSSQAS